MRCGFALVSLFLGVAAATPVQGVPTVKLNSLVRRPIFGESTGFAAVPDARDHRAIAGSARRGLANLAVAAATRQQPAQTGSITGRVSDARTGQPIASAQVFIEQGGAGGLTREDGRYLIQNVPEGPHKLTAELIGYQTLSATVTVTSGATAVHDFQMSRQAVAMNEIVVTGVAGGTQRRAVGNAVSSINASAINSAAPSTDVQQVLTGRATSVNMMGSGVVGAAPRIRIRGASTFSLAGNPLIYVDGVRMANDETTGFEYGNADGVRSMLSSLDPEDIAKIEVLKGPAAATLYGTEASRGVINIITKRGSSGKVKVDFLVRQGVNYIANPASSVGRMNYYKDPASGDIIRLNMVQHTKQEGVNVFGYGPVQDYEASLSGGSEDTQYYFSGGYSSENGVLSTDWKKALDLQTNLNTQLTQNLGLELAMGYTNSKDRLPVDGYSSVMEGVQFGSAAYLPQYRCAAHPGNGCDLLDGFTVQDVPSRGRSLNNNQNLNHFHGASTFNYTPTSWLTARLITGVDYTGEDDFAWRLFQTNDTVVASLGANASKGFRAEDRWTRFLTTTDLSATANLNVSSSLASSTSAGVQYYTTLNSELEAEGDQFAGPGLSTITAAAIHTVPTNVSVTDKSLGSYLQETLAWQSRLYLTGAVRVDNNSAFGSNIKLVTYPKASLSWVMNGSHWFQAVAPSWLNSLRLRAAWGESGEQPPSFSALRTWTPVTGPQNSAGVTPNTVGNPNLTAEVGEETELGFDSELLNSRLGLQFTYYYKLTKGAILERNLPPSGGFTGLQYFNAGRIMNRGVEAELDAHVLDSSKWTWDLGFNFSYNNSKILQLSGEPGDTTIIFNSWSSMEHRVGYAPYSWFGVKVVSAQLDPNTHKAINAMCSNGSGGTTPCFDASGNTIAPRVYLGRAIAPTEMSLSSDISFKNRLRLHAMFTADQGVKKFDNTLRQRCRLYDICKANYYPDQMDPTMQATIQSSDQIISSWVRDASFVRLKEVSLSYDLPQRLVRGFGLSRAVVQVAGRNLLTWSDWTEADPEVGYSSGSRMFMEQNNLPEPQQLVTTIRFSF
jgi:TonB-linked SusC/RagA family outer membrane protein